MQQPDNTEPLEIFYYYFDPSGLIIDPPASNDEPSQVEVVHGMAKP